MKRLSGLDASFLYLETPSAHMHVASALVFDPAGAPGGWSFERVKATVRDRLALVAPFRQRLVEVPFGLYHPLWVEDPGFDLDVHLRRAALPSPGGVAELADYAGDFVGRPLDRSRPLWEMHVVEGLEGGLVCVLTKVHHAAVDGTSGAGATAALLDAQPEPTAVAPAPWSPDRVPTEADMVSYALQALSRQPQAAARAARRALDAFLAVRPHDREAGAAAPAPFGAPRTSFNLALTPNRRVAFASVPLDDVKAVKMALGGTVNDVVLALCSGALRSYLAERGEKPDSSLVAMVPVSARAAGEAATPGNRLSAMLVALATDEPDPASRLAAVREATAAAKARLGALGADALAEWAELAAPALVEHAARLYSRTKVADRHRPVFNVVVSNVAGPDVPLYLAGARLVAFYPLGPVAEGVGLNVTVVSYAGTVHFGVVACREAVPDAWALARHLDDAAKDLKKAARAVTRP